MTDEPRISVAVLLELPDSDRAVEDAVVAGFKKAIEKTPGAFATVYRIPEEVLRFKHIVFEDLYSEVDILLPPVSKEGR